MQTRRGRRAPISLDCANTPVGHQPQAIFELRALVVHVEEAYFDPHVVGPVDDHAGWVAHGPTAQRKALSPFTAAPSARLQQLISYCIITIVISELSLSRLGARVLVRTVIVAREADDRPTESAGIHFGAIRQPSRFVGRALGDADGIRRGLRNSTHRDAPKGECLLLPLIR